MLWLDRLKKSIRWRDSGYATGMRADSWPERIYAIGDVHGRYDLLLAIEQTIAADAKDCRGDVYIVTLGDMIDRGPDSAAVVKHMRRPSDQFTRLALMGNHESMFLDFVREPSRGSVWLRHGGLSTLKSFGIDPELLLAMPMSERPAYLDKHVGHDTIEFLAGLPVFASFPGVLFVHAGIRPGIPLSRQRRADLLWIREPFLSAKRDDGLLVVHGHTPSGMPYVSPHRIGVDTGAYDTGILTTVCLEQGRPPRLLPVGPVAIWQSVAG